MRNAVVAVPRPQRLAQCPAHILHTCTFKPIQTSTNTLVHRHTQTHTDTHRHTDTQTQTVAEHRRWSRDAVPPTCSADVASIPFSAPWLRNPCTPNPYVCKRIYMSVSYIDVYLCT